MKKLLFSIAFFPLFLFLVSPAFAEDSYGFTFPDLYPGLTSYNFTYHNLTGTTVGVISISSPGIAWSAISSPSCSTYYLYNGGTNPAVEGCNLAPGDTITITVIPASPITTQPNDLSFNATSYDTNSGFATGQYNILSGHDYLSFTWNSNITPTPTVTPTPTSPPPATENGYGFAFPALTSPVTSYTFTYHNLSLTTVGVVGLSTPGITWALISSPSCSNSHLYNAGTNPAVEGCNLTPGNTMTITAISATRITTQPNDLSYSAASYDTNSGFATGQYNVVAGYDFGNLTWYSNTNAAPTVEAITISPNPVTVNTSVFASANFTDANTGDTHTATIDWGDGSSPQTCTVTESSGSGSVSCTKSSGYATANVYPVSIIVSDGSLSGTSATQYVSVYVPTVSSIFTAGQRFTSPAGAYPPNNSTTGNVIFGLSYKYQGTIPVGIRQFSMDFKAANFSFNATTISSLVIANGKAILRGTGTITNRTGTYDFLVVGIDGGGIRIKITDPANSNTVVYDTQLNEAENTTPTTSVNGHIIVH